MREIGLGHRTISSSNLEESGDDSLFNSFSFSHIDNQVRNFFRKKYRKKLSIVMCVRREFDSEV